MFVFVCGRCRRAGAFQNKSVVKDVAVRPVNQLSSLWGTEGLPVVLFSARRIATRAFTFNISTPTALNVSARVAVAEADLKANVL